MYYIGICDDEKAVCMQLADMVCAYDKRKMSGLRSASGIPVRLCIRT